MATDEEIKKEANKLISNSKVHNDLLLTRKAIKKGIQMERERLRRIFKVSSFRFEDDGDVVIEKIDLDIWNDV